MHKKRVGSDDPILGRIIRTWVCGGARVRRVAALRRGNHGEKGGQGGGAHQEPIPEVDLAGGGLEKWIDAKGRSSSGAPMAAGDGGPIPAGEASSEAWEGAGEVEDKGRKV